MAYNFVNYPSTLKIDEWVLRSVL